MEGLSLGDIGNICGGKVLANNNEINIQPSSISIDSRKLERNSLFVALPGEKTDGHLFTSEALQNGASCILVERLPDSITGPTIQVKSVLTALQELATVYRRRLNIPVVGVTGSVGKTTTKEMIASVLEQHYSVYKTIGNLNNEIGVPLSVLSIGDRNDIAVIEMGISDFGEMSVLANIARPDYMLFTSIGASHLNKLHDLQGVFEAKTEALKFLSYGAKVFYNGDDPFLKKMKCPQTLISYGVGEHCDVYATDIAHYDNGNTELTIHLKDGVIRTRCNQYGDHMIYSILAASAVADELGLSTSEISHGISDFQPESHRSHIIKSGQFTIIDDCYNANPTSTKMALTSLAHFSSEKVCILGDMLELGDQSSEYHRQIGAFAEKVGIRKIIAVGSQSSFICDGAGSTAKSFNTVDELIAALPDFLNCGDTILVKGSRGMHLERVVDFLQKL